MILLIDNYDSFVFNLARYFERLGQPTRVVRNDAIDAAAVDVQAALLRAQRQLPQDMTIPPSYRKVNPADSPVLFMALTPPSLSL